MGTPTKFTHLPTAPAGCRVTQGVGSQQAAPGSVLAGIIPANFPRVPIWELKIARGAINSRRRGPGAGGGVGVLTTRGTAGPDKGGRGVAVNIRH